MIRKSVVLLFTFISLTACSENRIITQMGDKTLCIPEKLIANLGSDGDNDRFHTYPTSERILINADDIQKDIPQYQMGVKSDRVPFNPQVNITQYQAHETQADNPDVSTYEPDFFKDVPNLESYFIEEDSRFLVYWEIFETQPNQSKDYWGDCGHKHFDPSRPIECHRELKVNDLTLTYPIAHANIATYPKVDRYLTERIADWHCDS